MIDQLCGKHYNNAKENHRIPSFLGCFLLAQFAISLPCEQQQRAVGLESIKSLSLVCESRDISLSLVHMNVIAAV